MSRATVNLIQTHLIRKLGGRQIRELTDAELQRLVNEYVERYSKRSFLSKLMMYLRAILDVRLDRRLIERNPARKPTAKSRKRPSKQAHALEECELLLAQVSGGDHFEIRL